MKKKGTFKKILQRVGKYKFLMALSIIFAAVTVLLTLYIPILIGDAIEGQYVANNLHFAAAIAFILMIILLVCMGIANYFTSKRVYGGK